MNTDDAGIREPFYDCGMTMQVTTIIEGNALVAELGKQVIGLQAAVESLRNETAKERAAQQNMMSMQVQALSRDGRALTVVE